MKAELAANSKIIDNCSLLMANWLLFRWTANSFTMIGVQRVSRPETRAIVCLVKNGQQWRSHQCCAAASSSPRPLHYITDFSWSILLLILYGIFALMPVIAVIIMLTRSVVSKHLHLTCTHTQMLVYSRIVFAFFSYTKLLVTILLFSSQIVA